MKIIFLTFTFSFISLHTIFSSSLDSLYQELDRVIDERTSLDAIKEKEIDTFRVILESDTTALREKYFLATEIFKLYEIYEFYGAMHFINEAIKFANELEEIELINESHINLASLLIRAGIYQEPSEILNNINVGDLTHSQLKNYYVSYKELYNQLYFYSPTKYQKEEYQKKYNDYCTILLKISPENSFDYLEIKETQALDLRDVQKARKINALRMSRTRQGQGRYSKIAFQRSMTYEIENDLENQQKYLLLSAISDIKGSIKDNASLATLAFKLYHGNDIERAYKYINISYEDALFYNSKLRAIQIANILPLISKSYDDRLVEKKESLQYYTVITSILSLILIVAVFLILRQVRNVRKARNISVEVNKQLKESNSEIRKANKKLKKLHKDLSKTNHVKEVYIGEFLKICSDYVNKLESQALYTQKMLVGRKYGELLNELKGQDLRKVEMKLFYKNFDETFLNIYPDFVEEINRLLDPEDPIKLKAKDLLNTELRIFALVRLGISDSAKISKLLGNSVTTIYNYRVKIKNKAVVDRDKFEDYIMKIGE